MDALYYGRNAEVVRLTAQGAKQVLGFAAVRRTRATTPVISAALDGDTIWMSARFLFYKGSRLAGSASDAFTKVADLVTRTPRGSRWEPTSST